MRWLTILFVTYLFSPFVACDILIKDVNLAITVKKTFCQPLEIQTDRFTRPNVNFQKDQFCCQMDCN